VVIGAKKPANYMPEIALETLQRCVNGPRLYVVNQLQIFTEINEETIRYILTRRSKNFANINALFIYL